MTRKLLGSLFIVLGAIWGPQALSQSSDIESATVGTCNLKGSVSVTVLGVTTTTPLACLNETTQDAPGEDSDSITGDVNVSVPGVVDVANVTAPNGVASYLVEPDTTLLSGLAEVKDIDLAQDTVAANSVQGDMSCEQSTGDNFIECQGEVSIASLDINGLPASVPSPTPYNYTIPVSSSLQVSVLGLLPVSVPVSGDLKLNEVVVSGATPQVSGPSVLIPMQQPGESLTVEHNAMHLSLDGSVQLLGIGLVEVEVDIIDYFRKLVEMPPRPFP